MKTSYFLGANSKDGFASLYDQFAAEPGDRLHVIKGGPGTGKSGYMRRLGAAAEERGYDVAYVLCSGDPDSLDGVYIPALKQAWVDGTAPHIMDPAFFGASGDYVNLGGFCRLPLSVEDSAAVLALNHSYKGLYGRAYAYLAAAAALRQACLPNLAGPELSESIGKRIDGILRRHSRRREGKGRMQRRFLSAISCQGLIRLKDSVTAFYPLVYWLDDGLHLADRALKQAALLSQKRGLDLICCPSPLDPSELDAVLLPQEGLAFLRDDWGIDGAHHIRLDALVPAPLQKELRPERRRGQQAESAALEAAMEKLRQAKALHDELEAVYRPYMDFEALTAFTDREILRIFGK